MDSKTKMKFNVLAIIFILIFSFTLAPRTLQNDTFYTISIGEHIMENGIDREDPFAWTDLKYTYPHWLYDTCTYLVYDTWGMTGLYVVTGLLASLLGVLIYITNLKVNKNNLFSFALTIGVMFLISDFIAARAQLVSFILFVMEILFVECFLTSKKKRYIIGLAIIACLLANMHAAVFYVFFILLLPYFAEYLIIVIRDSNFTYKLSIHRIKSKIEKLAKKEQNPEKIEKSQIRLENTEKRLEKFKANAKRREENPYRIRLERRPAVKWLMLGVILFLLMGLLTPIGDEPYTHIFKLLSGNTTESISEHQALVVYGNVDMTIVLVILIGLLVFTDTKISYKDAFMIAGLLILALSARRQLSLLIIIGVFSLSRLICECVSKYDKSGSEEFVKMVVSWQGKLLTVLVLVVCSASLLRAKIDHKYINDEQYPVYLADFMLSEQASGNLDFESMKIYNDYNYGSYLLFRGIPVFIDSRADLYSPEFNEGCNIFGDYMDISSLSVYYEDKFEEYNITHAVTYANSKLNMLLSRNEDYKELYKDKYFVLYERLNVEKENA